MSSRGTCFIWIFLLLLTVGVGGTASAYNSGNILANGGFETGNLSEPANDAMGNMPWMTSNTQNSIAATKAAAHTGQFGLEWNPIGWNVKQDGALEDGSTFIVNACTKHIAAGARTVRVAGFANTSALAASLRMQVVLANGSFKNVNFDTSVAGGAQGWQQFEASLALDPANTTLFLAFLVTGTKGVGAAGSAVYLDDLELSYAGPEEASQPAAAAAPEKSSTAQATTATATAPDAGANAAAGAYDSGNILNNGGFEKGDLSESANDTMGNVPWLTSNTQNTIAATGTNVHAGKFSLEWKPIGWNVKADGTTEDAGTFILNNCTKYIVAGALKVHVAGFANTSALSPDFRLQVILANGTFKNFNFDASVAGGAQGWQRFEASMPLDSSDTTAILAFNVTGTKGKGAPGSGVYLDDLELSYRGPEKAAAQAGTGAAAQPSAAQTPAPEAATRPFLMGFTPFAWDLDEEVANRSMEFVVTHGDIICHHFDGGVPWTEALEDKPFSEDFEKDWRKRKDGTPENVKVYVALTPVSGMRNGMALYRGEKENMPLPEPFQNKKFSDPVIKKAYLNYCRRAADFFRPDFLAIGIEVNEIRHTAPDQWADLVELHRYVRDELKKAHPTLPIFATLTLHNLLNKEWKDIEAERESIKAFLPLNDIAGVSFYSFFSCLGPAESPKESFDWIRSFVGNMPIAICETAFPAERTKLSWAGTPIELPGSAEGQKAYYETLLSAAARDNYLFVITFLYRDYDRLWDKIKTTTPDWAGAWKDTGLLNEDGESRPAWQVWEKYRALKCERLKP